MIADLNVIILSDPLRIKYAIDFNHIDITIYSAIGKSPAINAINRLGLQAHIEEIITILPTDQELINDPKTFDHTIPLHRLNQIVKVLRCPLS